MLRRGFNICQKIRKANAFALIASGDTTVYRILRQQQLCLPVTQRYFHVSGADGNVQTYPRNLDKTLTKIDNEIRRTGRVNREEIDEILQDIKDMKRATSSQSLMIIRCCGELVPGETPENRTKLVHNIWKTLENLNVPMDISHYNALLRVYLENEHKFNPTDFLQMLSSRGIEPNRVTYQRLIARYCQEGNIDGATTILQHMKEKQLPINEHVFNALVLGHAQADDMESAEGMLSVMQQAGLQPSDDTYVTLMCGYARKGDLENIRRIVQVCEEKDIHLLDKDFLNIIFIMAQNGHDHLVDDVMKFFRKAAGFNQEATNTILRLVNIQKEDLAYKILKEMPKVIRNDEALPSGTFFIGQLVKSDTPSSKVIDFCKKMMEEEVHKYALAKACDFALQTKKNDKAIDFLEAWKEMGAPMRPHYFWPLFASSKSDQDIYEYLKKMRRLGVEPNFETLREYIVPALFRNSKDSVEQVLERFSSYSKVPLAQLVPHAMQHFLESGNTDLATKFATSFRLNFRTAYLRRSLIDWYMKEDKPEDFVKIFGTSSLEGDDNAREIAGILVVDLLETCNNRNKVPKVTPVLKEMLRVGIGLSNSGSELIQTHVGDQLTDELSELILQLTSPDLHSKLDLTLPKSADNQLILENKSLPELLKLKEEAVRSGRPTRGISKAIIFAASRQKNLEVAESTYEELKNDGFVFTSGMNALMMDLYSHHNKVEDATRCYKAFMQTTDVPMDDIKILRYASLLISNDKFNDALEVIQKTARNEDRKPFGALQQALVWRTLNTLAEKGDVEKVKQLQSALTAKNLMNVNNVTMGPLIKAYLTNDNLEGALEEFQRCVENHHITPWKQDLFCRFIKAEDSDRLQKVIDLSTRLHGEVNSMYDLVFAFIECGKLRQARKILETPGLRTRNDKIEFRCQKYLEEGRVAELENLVEITKDVFNIDRNSLYFYLLQAYCKINDTEKAMSVWTSMQEENIQASKEFLLFLADFLQKNNKEVPFVVPTVEPNVTDKETIISNFRSALGENNVDEAIHLKHSFEGNETSSTLSIGDYSGLIEKLIRAERIGEAAKLCLEMFERGNHPYPNVLRRLFTKLSTIGEVETLTQFEKSLTNDVKRKTLFNTRMAIAYVNSGRGKEYFEDVVKPGVGGSEDSSKDEFLNPLAGSTYLLLKNPDLYSQFEELTQKASPSAATTLSNAMWCFHLLNKNFEKAKEIYETKLKEEPRPNIRSVLIECKKNLDVDTANHLVSQLSTSTAIQPSSLAFAHSTIINLLCLKKLEKEALDYLNKCLESHKLEDFSPFTLRFLKQELENKNMTFPYDISKLSSRRGSRRLFTEVDSDGES